MKAVILGIVAVAVLAGCASTPVQDEMLKQQIESNNTQKEILMTLKQIQAQQKH